MGEACLGRQDCRDAWGIVELASTPQLVNDPLHPHSKALLGQPEADPELTRAQKNGCSLEPMTHPLALVLSHADVVSIRGARFSWKGCAM